MPGSSGVRRSTIRLFQDSRCARMRGCDGHIGVTQPDPACLQHMQRGPHARSSCRRCFACTAHTVCVPFDGARRGSFQVGGRVAQPCSVVRTRDRVAGAALLAPLTPSAAHFLKSHQLLVQKVAADLLWTLRTQVGHLPSPRSAIRWGNRPTSLLAEEFGCWASG
jgi:hypothetical protein